MACSWRACVVALGLLTAACPNENGPRIYDTRPHAPSMTDDDVAAMKHLGPTVIDGGVNFSVYSERATRMEVLLFDEPESELPTRQFELTRFGDVWSVWVGGIGYGQHYGYVAWGPNWVYTDAWFPGDGAGFVADVDADGNRFNPNKLLLDPYALALHRDHDWSKGSTASGPQRTDLTYDAAAKSVVVRSDYEWSAAEATWRQNRQDPEWAGHRWNEQILYEVHVKGFTADSISGVDYPGTYRGFGEKAAYFAELGVTGVELLPVHEKPLDGGYWGYQTLSFFVPELSYATASAQRRVAEGAVIDEFKWMVDQLHQQGVEVILDVVYNHTGEGGLWRDKIDYSLDPETDNQLGNFDPKEVAGIYAYRGLDNAAYYALAAGNQTYWNDTGVGNQTRCNHAPMRKLIVDSLRYWVEEMHVDGFRFDLAPVLGARDMDYSVWDAPANTVLQDIIDDPVLQKYNTRIIAEPWAAGGPGFKLGEFPASTNRADFAWGEWNSHFRDWWRSFVNEDGWVLDSDMACREEGCVDGGATLTGSYPTFARNGRKPWHSMNFVTVHDGFTMYDLFSYDSKVNGCGPLNPFCCDNPMSALCDLDSGEDHNRSRAWGDEDFKRQLMRNLFVAMLVSHGTPLLYGGDEWLRTQLGNNNAYSTMADNPHNWFKWGEWNPANERHRMRDFVAKMTRLRKQHLRALSPQDYGAYDPAWKTPANADMQPADWGGKQVALHYWDESKGPQLDILINMGAQPVTFQLPQGVTWHRVVDTQLYFDTASYFDQTGLDPLRSANVELDAPEALPSAEYGVPGYTIVILEAR